MSTSVTPSTVDTSECTFRTSDRGMVRAARAVGAATRRRLLSDERGMTTAEYAVGTVAAASLGGLFIKLLTSEEVRNLLWSLISNALGAFV